MMREDIRKARVKKYGSFLFCPEHDTICSCLDNEMAICSREPCLYDDPEWIKEQEIIRRNRGNAEPRKEKAPVIKATTLSCYTKEQQIKYEEELAARLYRMNRPNAAEAALMRARMLKSR